MPADDDTPRLALFACPCCGFLTLDEAPAGTHQVCEVCFWEDDSVQFNAPDSTGGANVVSLNQARLNFRALGASEQRFLTFVRPPRSDERP